MDDHPTLTTHGFLKDRTVLVTGAGGFIGSQLVEALLEAGAHVRAFARYNSRGDPGLLHLLPQEMTSRFDLIPGDLRDLQAIQAAMKGCEFVFHLGALISIPYSYLHPAEVAQTNFIGTLNVLLACRELGVRRLIHTSTSEVYGTALHVPMDEDHPLQGQSPYSASKIGADKLAESFYCAYGLPVTTVRPFNTFGPRQSARAVIPTVITQALTMNTIHLGNLDARRDFTYVDDTVNGFVQAVQAEGAAGKTFNLGTGREISIGELARLVIQKVSRPVEIVVDPERLRPEKSEVQRLLSDNSLAKEVLGWQPRVPFEQGLERTIAWVRSHLELYRPGRYEF
ncbi:MAG TPA: SDR family NAD(P)-dependent oxidoreductase [Anaerolineales bacterium]|nr:SDR family NAD(P)-dependent oxidoreductase [Anaerolineales bacterium]